MKLNLLILSTLLFSNTVYLQKSFTEVTQEAGINHVFEVDLATFGGGAAVIDFDNDGWEDLYITGGKAPDVLYRNNGDGTFTNVFANAGFDRTKEIYTQGVSAADVNRDGFKDLLITTMYYANETRPLAPNLLYLNNGDGTFEDVTEDWGLSEFLNNSQGATFGDINADGFPDLYVSNYFSASPTGVSIFNEQTITNSFEPAQDYLFINASGKSFVDASRIYGMEHTGFGFQGVFTDYDNDRDLDLYIANDFGFKSTPNVFLRNDFPTKKYTDRSLGLAMNFGMNAMGIAACDFNFDGWMDYFVSNLSTSLFVVNQKNGNGFENLTFALGLDIPTILEPIPLGPPISWGANFFDYDNDTDMDLFVCNGALNPTIRANPNFFFEFENGKFREVARDKKLADERIGRGSVVFDYDRDGDLDLFVVNQKPRDITSTLPDARCLLYRNDTDQGNWLKVELKGIKSEKNGLGSRIELMVDGKLLIREIAGGSSHLSQNSTIAHFGLGAATELESLTVKWMGGGVQVLEDVAVNQEIVIEENFTPQAGLSKNNLKVSPGAFSSEIFLEYELSVGEPFTVDVVDVKGRQIAVLADLESAVFNGLLHWEVPSDLPKGIYIFRLITKDSVVAKKAVKI